MFSNLSKTEIIIWATFILLSANAFNLVTSKILFFWQRVKNGWWIQTLLNGQLSFFPVGNLCFYGECTYYCDSRHAFCGDVDMIEGSLMVFLPSKTEVNRDRWRSPYRRYFCLFWMWREIQRRRTNMSGIRKYYLFNKNTFTFSMTKSCALNFVKKIMG